MKLFLSPQSSKSSNVNHKEGPISPQSSLKSAKVGPAEVQEGPLSTFVLDKNNLNAEWQMDVNLRYWNDEKILQKLFL